VPKFSGSFFIEFPLVGVESGADNGYSICSWYPPTGTCLLQSLLDQVLAFAGYILTTRGSVILWQNYVMKYDPANIEPKWQTFSTLVILWWFW